MPHPPSPIPYAMPPFRAPVNTRAVFKKPVFFLLRTAPNNRQTPTATNRHQPPPTASRQPPTFEVEKVP